MNEPWQEYLAAAQRLDVVRRTAANAAGQQAIAVQAAQQELTGLRARLAPQQARLRAAGVPEPDLVPTEPEVTAAGQAMAAGPDAALAALRAARADAETADALTRPTGLLSWPDGWPRWPLVAGSVVLVVVAVLVGLCALGAAHLLG